MDEKLDQQSIDRPPRLRALRSAGAAGAGSKRETKRPSSGRRMDRLIHSPRDPAETLKNLKLTAYILLMITLVNLGMIALIQYWFDSNG